MHGTRPASHWLLRQHMSRTLPRHVHCVHWFVPRSHRMQGAHSFLVPGGPRESSWQKSQRAMFLSFLICKELISEEEWNGMRLGMYLGIGFLLREGGSWRRVRLMCVCFFWKLVEEAVDERDRELSASGGWVLSYRDSGRWKLVVMSVI